MNFEGIHNYYEKLVFNQLALMELAEDEDLQEDIACIALNQLPAKYVRHNVDILFYMSSEEHEKMNQDVTMAVNKAIEYINNK